MTPLDAYCVADDAGGLTSVQSVGVTHLEHAQLNTVTDDLWVFSADARIDFPQGKFGPNNKLNGAYIVAAISSADTFDINPDYCRELTGGGGTRWVPLKYLAEWTSFIANSGTIRSGNCGGYPSCEGSIPTYAVMYDLTESQPSIKDATWHYSPTNTSAKCEYHCDTGYEWHVATSTCELIVIPLCDNNVLGGCSAGTGTVPVLSPSGDTYTWTCSGSIEGGTASCIWNLTCPYCLDPYIHTVPCTDIVNATTSVQFTLLPGASCTGVTGNCMSVCDAGDGYVYSNGECIPGGCGPNKTYCGNGTLESGEQCDLGSANGIPGGSCGGDCLCQAPYVWDSASRECIMGSGSCNNCNNSCNNTGDLCTTTICDAASCSCVPAFSCPAGQYCKVVSGVPTCSHCGAPGCNPGDLCANPQECGGSSDGRVTLVSTISNPACCCDQSITRYAGEVITEYGQRGSSCVNFISTCGGGLIKQCGSACGAINCGDGTFAAMLCECPGNTCS